MDARLGWQFMERFLFIRTAEEFLAALSSGVRYYDEGAGVFEP